MNNFETWNEEMFKKHAINEKDRYTHKNLFVRYITNKRVNLIIKWLNPSDQDNIIDLGCGHGRLIEKINKGKITGVDLSSTALELAKKINQNKKNLRLIKGDIQDINLKDKYNKIICVETIEHLPNPEKVINKICNIATKDAKIVITIPNEKNIDLIKKFFGVFLKQISGCSEWHLHRFDLKKLKELTKDKLDIVKIKKNPLFFPMSYVVLFRLK